MKKSERPFLVNVRDAAVYLRVDPVTIYRLLKKRDIPGALKVGRVWRFDLDEFELFLERETQRLK